MKFNVYVGSRFIAMNQRTFRKLLTYQLKCRLYFLCTTAYDILNRTG